MRLTSGAIVDYALDLSLDDVPDDVVEAAKRHVLDSLGCCLGAVDSPPAGRLRDLYGSLTPGSGAGHPGTATVVGTGTRTTVEYAALANAAMVRYLDANDTYISAGRACHPSDHVPALLAVAEAEGASGAAFLEAVVLAYELECLGLDTGAAWERGLDYVVWGGYSGAAAAGRLAGLDRGAMRDAVGIATTSNLALSIARRGEVSMWKGVAHPYVSHNAVQAVSMAGAGLTGPAAVFEGPGGFEEVVAGGPLEVDRWGGRDGAAFRLPDVHLKPYPCGYYLQPIVASVLDLVETHDVDPDAVEAVEVETFDQAAAILAGEEKWAHDLTRESADHSIPYTVAVALRFGDVRVEHYDDATRARDDVHRLMDRVTVTTPDDLNEAAAAAPTSTPSRVRLAVDGETFEARLDRAPGHAERPLSDEALEAKVARLAEGARPPSAVEALVERCSSLEDEPDVEGLVAALAG